MTVIQLSIVSFYLVILNMTAFCLVDKSGTQPFESYFSEASLLTAMSLFKSLVAFP